MPQILAGRDADFLRRPPQIAKLDLVPARTLGELGVVGEEGVHARLDVETVPYARLEDAAPYRREPAAGRGDAD